VAKDSFAHSLDRVVDLVVSSDKRFSAFRKKVGNAIAGNDAQPTGAQPTAKPAAPTQPAAGAVDDKKSTTPADQTAPADKPKVDANGIEQGKLGYTSASGWKIEHVLASDNVWGNEKLNQHATLPKGQEP
jgi:hypothetical protein